MNLLRRGLAAMLLALTIGLLGIPVRADVAIIDDPLHWPKQCADDVQPTAGASALERMSKLKDVNMTAAQHEAAAKIASGPRGCIFGPFLILQRSPEILTRAQMLGEYLRFKSVIPPRLREFAILITGRSIAAPYVWYIHLPEALRAGVRREEAAALAKGERPTALDDDEAVIYDLLDGLHRNNDVSDTVYAKARARFGETGLVELVALDSYFSLLGREINMARLGVPASIRIPFKAPWEQAN